MAEASGLGPEGWRFESSPRYQQVRVAEMGNAAVCKTDYAGSNPASDSMPGWRNLVGATDLKSVGVTPVSVRARLPVPYGGVAKLVNAAGSNPAGVKSIVGSTPTPVTKQKEQLWGNQEFRKC